MANKNAMTPAVCAAEIINTINTNILYNIAVDSAHTQYSYLLSTLGYVRIS
jgi:hypothetical protein